MPEEVLEISGSHTGHFLKQVLAKHPAREMDRLRQEIGPIGISTAELVRERRKPS